MISDTKVFARNFRGFKEVEVDLSGTTFVVGDNSSGKSSILYLVDSVLKSGLVDVPKLSEELGVGEFDYFSPFFEFADVVVGAEIVREEKKYAKLITLSRRLGKVPEVIRTSYFSEASGITLRRLGKQLFVKFWTGGDGGRAQQYDRHNSTQGYTKTDSLAGGQNIMNPMAAYFSLRNGKPDVSQFRDVLVNFDLDSASLLGPIRSLPAKHYDTSVKASNLGAHFAVVWKSFKSAKLRTHLAAASRFGQEGKIFEKIFVEPINRKVPDSPLIVSVEIGGQRLSLTQVGVGVSQVIPVLAETIRSMSDKDHEIALLQQPELHLHPVAQAALGSYFFRMAQGGLCSFIETHSQTLIDRFTSDLRDRGLSKEFNPVRVLFCERTSEGNTGEAIHIDDNGNMIDVPEKYYRFFLEELGRTM